MDLYWSFVFIQYRCERFPRRLYRLLKDTEGARGRPDLISFTNGGTAFQIHQPEEFERVVLPLYFRHGKLSSFLRQCRKYGFKRVLKENGRRKGVYTYNHPLFRDGKPELCDDIDLVDTHE